LLDSGELELNEGDESDPPPQAVNIKAEKTHKESILIFILLMLYKLLFI